MSNPIEDSSIADNCPNCGQRTEKTIAWLKQNNIIECDRCGTRREIDPRAIGRFQQAAELMANAKRAPSS